MPQVTSLDGVLGGFETGFNAQKIFNVLCEKPYGLTWRELAEHLWCDDPEGGPLCSRDSIAVTASKFNSYARQRKAGFRIKVGSLGDGLRYKVWIVRE